MTSKDYKLLAQALHSVKPDLNIAISDQNKLITKSCLEQWEDTVIVISEALLKQNPRFNESKFLKACNEGLPDKDK